MLDTLHQRSSSPALDLLFFVNYVYMCVCVRVCACECRCPQKPAVSGPLELDTQYWKQKWGPLEDQCVLVSTEQSLQPAWSLF